MSASAYPRKMSQNGLKIKQKLPKAYQFMNVQHFSEKGGGGGGDANICLGSVHLFRRIWYFNKFINQKLHLLEYVFPYL